MQFVSVGQDAVGFLAIGQHATGVVAIGQSATGVVALGQLALGVVAVGQVSRGVVALGQLAFGVVVVGQVVAGVVWAAGQLALAPFVGASMLGIPVVDRLPWSRLRRLQFGRRVVDPPRTRPRRRGADAARAAVVLGLVVASAFVLWAPLIDGLAEVFRTPPRVLR